MFGPRIHERTESLRGDATAAFDLARTTILAVGFEITHDSDSELRARGPGMSHNKQPPLTSVSELRLRATSSTINAKATLGGVANMKVFLYLFPPGLALFLLITFKLMGMPVSWPMVLWLAPWIVIAPLMTRALEKRVVEAVDGLVRSMAQVAARKGGAGA